MSNYSVVYFIKDDSVEAVPSVWVKDNYCAWSNSKLLIPKYIKNRHTPNYVDFKYIKIRILCKNITSLSEAKSKANIAMYRSNFTDDDDNISNRNKPNSPARSNAPMPLFSDSDNENGSKMMVSKKPFLSMKCVSAGSIKNHTKKLQQGWSPSPNKLKYKSFTTRKLSFTHDVSDVFDFKKTKNLPIHSTIETTSIDIEEHYIVAVYYNKCNTPISISNVVPADQSLETKDTAANVSSKASTVSDDTIIKNNIMHNLAFLKVEMRQIQSNQSQMFEHFESILTHLQGNNT